VIDRRRDRQDPPRLDPAALGDRALGHPGLVFSFLRHLMHVAATRRSRTAKRARGKGFFKLMIHHIGIDEFAVR
jgi:hypothetical protein